MDVRMPDGTIIKNVPEGTTKQELMAKLSRNGVQTPSDGRGNIINSDVPTVAGEVPNPPVVNRQTSLMDKAKAVYEVPATLLSGAALAVPSAVSALATGEGPMAMAERNMYQPRSPASQDALQAIGSAFEATKLPPVMPSGMLPSYARILGQSSPMVNAGVDAVQQNTSKLASALKRTPEPSMAGVGAAATDPAVMRMKLAEQLRVPTQISKGQATRDLDQQFFELETAKTNPADIGKPLVDLRLKQNQDILANFDAFLEPIGAEVASPMNLREVGQVVDKALIQRTKQAKGEINAAYTKAREAGELEAPVNITPIKNYLDSMEAEAVNAPIITSAKMKLDKIAPGGQVSINDLEEVRKMVGRLSGSTPTNQLYGKEINKLIDASTEGVGGDLYRQARSLRSNYAREFENVGVIDKLLSTKPGTTDRSVAFENVFDHAILNGSLDDVKAIGQTLKRSGKDGEQAWRELTGQTVEYMREAITANSKMDANGLPIVSPAKFKNVVNNLDKSGKLDYLFGKKGAQEIRDLRDVALNIYTLPEGANTSNTSSALMRKLDTIAKSFGVSRLTSPITNAIESSATKKRVNEAVTYSPEKMAEILKKGK